MTTTIGVVRETTPGERRVALVPDVAARLRGAGMEVLIEASAGAASKFSDGAYADAGATVTTAAEVYERADVLACVSPPDGAALHPGQVLLGLLQPLARPVLIRDLARTRITAISLDLLPRTLSRAQPMDALTSQASVAGYKAVLVAADAYGGYQAPDLVRTVALGVGDGQPQSFVVGELATALLLAQVQVAEHRVADSHRDAE